METMQKAFYYFRINKSLSVYGFIVIILAVLIFILSGKFAYNYNESLKINNEREMMQTYIKTFNAKHTRLEGMKYVPIPESKIDNVQTKILMSVQNFKLTLNSMQGAKKNTKIDGLDFTVDVTGQWKDMASFIGGFETGYGKCLIRIREVLLSPVDGGQVNAKISYRVYTLKG